MANEDEVLLNLKAEDKSVEDTTKQIIKVMEELDSTIKKLTSSFSDFNNANEQTTQSNKKTTNSTQKIISTMNAYKLSALGVGKALKDFTLQAAEAYGVQTKFNALYDKTSGELQEAKEWVDKWANALYLDSIQVENVASKFRLLTQTMGINNEKSKEITQNMTQLAYDLSAVSGNQDDVTTTMNAINSALAGQTKALTKYGIALNQNSLQETLNAAGINKKVSALNSAQKTELLYTQIMKSSAGIQGYYAKTLMSPANALNIIKTRFSILAREIGNVFIPILMALVPVVITVTKALRALAQAIAKFFGISIDFDAYETGFEGISAGIGGIGDSADAAGKKVKNMIRDFDDLHVINFDTDTGSSSGVGAGIGGGGASLFDKQEYADWESYLDGIQGKLKGLLPLLTAIGAIFAAWKISEIIEKVKTFIKLLDKNPFVEFILGIILVVDGFILLKNGINDIINGNISLKSVLEAVGGTLLTFIGTLAILKAASKWNIMGLGALGLPALAKIALGVTATIVGLTIAISALKVIMDKGREASYLWLAVLGGISLAMIGLTIAGAPLIAIILGLGAAIFYFVALVQDLCSRIHNLIDPTVEVIDAFDWMSDRVKSLGDTISSITKGVTGDYEDTTKSIIDDLNLIDIDTKLTTDNIDKYLTDDMRKILGMSESDWVKYKESILATQSNLTTDTKNNLDDIQANINTTDNTFDTATDNINNYLDEVDKNMNETSNSMISGIKDTSENCDKYSKEIVTDLDNINKVDIKTPTFSWQEAVSSAALGALLPVLSFLGLPTLLPKLAIEWVSTKKYATGGFPEKGDLFIANEREPELIGSMGNRSVVANNAQITEGIAQASYNAFRRAFNEMQNGFGGDTIVYVGDTQITDIITKKKRIQDKRFGR